jgi:SNF family Na+-dependent transporter
MASKPSEAWSSRLGVILAVAGSAVGLGNFLRFPGLAAHYGSGAFMIAYFISLLLIGFPTCWVEWTLGRHAGQFGFRSSPGIFSVLIRHPLGKYLGALGVLIPVCIYMYYVYIEAWCLGYAWYFLRGELSLGTDVARYGDFFARFVGLSEDGLVVQEGSNQVVLFLLLVFTLNFIIIYRGLAKGIEIFCKWAMPALIVLAIIILVRVLTLGTPDPTKPEQNVLNGLGSMWNPGDVGQQLRNPQLWLAAAGQIFFSLSVGFGVIITYASYLSNRDDVVLSGLTASSANEFCEVALGGMITVPAAFVFLGTAGVVGQGTFALGFKVLPLVLATMPWPAFFGTVFFTLLFLAAVTSSLSMLQPGIAFLEEALGVGRKSSVAILGMVTAMGCLFVVHFSKDLKALDTLDFWVGTFLIFVMATVLVVTFGWGLGIDRGFAEAHRGAHLRIPSVFKPIIRYVTPAYLLIIFALWLLFNVLGWNPDTGGFAPTGSIADLVGTADQPPSAVARFSVLLVGVMLTFTLVLIAAAAPRWKAKLAAAKSEEKGT